MDQTTDKILLSGQKRRGRAALGATAILVASVLLSGCHIDMWRNSKIEPYQESDFYADRQTSRALVTHTVPVGDVEADDPAFYTGYVNGKAEKTIPVRAVKDFASPKEMLLRGQDRFDAYCSPCHGRTGNGNGFVMQRGLGYRQKLAASYQTDRLRKIEDGYIYDVLVNGHGVMYGYGERIKSPDDRWAIVSYVRVLQLASNPNGTVQPAAVAPPATGAVQVPALNATPGAAAEQPATGRPINRTPGGDATVRPNQPAETGATPVAAPTAAPASPAATTPATGETKTP